MLEEEQFHIERAKSGDSVSFGALYDHYLKLIYRFIAVKVTTRQEAEDLAHEVFVSAWRQLPSYQAQGYPFGSWLYKIARNKVIDYYRTRKSHVSLDETLLADTELFGVNPEHEKVIDASIDLTTIERALKELSPEQREIIELRFMADLSPAEIAKAVGKREGNVRIIQHRALQKLKKIIGE